VSCREDWDLVVHHKEIICFSNVKLETAKPAHDRKAHTVNLNVCAPKLRRTASKLRTKLANHFSFFEQIIAPILESWHTGDNSNEKLIEYE